MFGTLFPASKAIRGHEVSETLEQGAWVHVQMRSTTTAAHPPVPRPFPHLLRLRLQIQAIPCVHNATLQLIHDGQAQAPIHLYRGSHPSAQLGVDALAAIELRTTEIGFFQGVGETTWRALGLWEGRFTADSLKLPIQVGVPVYRKPFKTCPPGAQIIHNVHTQGRQLQVNDLPPNTRPLHAYAGICTRAQSLLHAEQYYCTLAASAPQSQLEIIAHPDLPGVIARTQLLLQDPPSDAEKTTLHTALLSGDARITAEERIAGQAPTIHTYRAIDVSELSPGGALVEVIFQHTS